MYDLQKAGYKFHDGALAATLCKETQIGEKNYPNVVQAPFPNFLPLFPRGIPRNLGRVVEWQVKTSVR